MSSRPDHHSGKLATGFVISELADLESHELLVSFCMITFSVLSDPNARFLASKLLLTSNIPHPYPAPDTHTTHHLHEN